MPNPTAQQLANIMLPLFKREPELRPTGLKYHSGKRRQVDDDGCSYVSAWQWTLHNDALIDNEGLESATQLCESSMVRWLAAHAKQRINGICLNKSYSRVKIILDSYYEEFDAPTLVEALAAACSAVLDVKEQEKESTL